MQIRKMKGKDMEQIPKKKSKKKMIELLIHWKRRRNTTTTVSHPSFFHRPAGNFLSKALAFGLAGQMLVPASSQAGIIKKIIREAQRVSHRVEKEYERTENRVGKEIHRTGHHIEENQITRHIVNEAIRTWEHAKQAAREPGSALIQYALAPITLPAHLAEEVHRIADKNRLAVVSSVFHPFAEIGEDISRNNRELKQECHEHRHELNQATMLAGAVALTVVTGGAAAPACFVSPAISVRKGGHIDFGVTLGVGYGLAGFGVTYMEGGHITTGANIGVNSGPASIGLNLSNSGNLSLSASYGSPVNVSGSIGLDGKASLGIGASSKNGQIGGGITAYSDGTIGVNAHGNVGPVRLSAGANSNGTGSLAGTYQLPADLPRPRQEKDASSPPEIASLASTSATNSAPQVGQIFRKPASNQQIDLSEYPSLAESLLKEPPTDPSIPTLRAETGPRQHLMTDAELAISPAERAYVKMTADNIRLTANVVEAAFVPEKKVAEYLWQGVKAAILPAETAKDDDFVRPMPNLSTEFAKKERNKMEEKAEQMFKDSILGKKI